MFFGPRRLFSILAKKPETEWDDTRGLPRNVIPLRLYVYVYVCGGHLKGVQVVGKNVFPTTCTPFSRPPAHFWVLKVQFLGPETTLLGPESAFWGPESALLGPESELSAEGCTSGKENLFPYTRIPMMMGWGGDRSSLGWMMVQGSY